MRVEEVGYGVADGIRGRDADSRPPRKRFESFNRAANSFRVFPVMTTFLVDHPPEETGASIGSRRDRREFNYWSQDASYAFASMSASSSFGSVIFTFIIHPSVYAPSFTLPGESARSSFTATTSPLTGE